ncbi:putative Na+/H+ antiporter [Uliginosibacterium sp. H3]|uniref:Na+/H+ antiporter n=1 Tax=Uliginosibacterium silvisoli TaxID=3114758 RepID=A0ABU6K6K1_9RHOO|nr:putative Na+/H+ antiporter [Uliginosibacterium sp. H3]
MSPSTIEIIGAVLFGIALIHTFSTKIFERLADRQTAHSGVWHILAEVEAVFGFWAMILIVFMLVLYGKPEATRYLDSLNFTEPMFVFAIMVVAGSRPILELALALVNGLARLLPISHGASFYVVTLIVVPLLGSFITEPAAMTLAAFILRDQYYKRDISARLKYATLGVLFVNISIGGVMTPYAAPPVLMVAGKWGWDLNFMFFHFGWKAACAVVVNAVAATLLFHKELAGCSENVPRERAPVPLPISIISILFLCGVVVFAHTPAAFISLLLFFIGFAHAYERHQDELILREGLMVGFFLAGLIVLGGQQKWWLQDILAGMNDLTLYFGATALTAITDNAALTYLGSLVDGIDDGFKYALVAGAVTGGGLTVIANAPNPAGYTILREHFADGAISPAGLLAAAALPTLVAVCAFQLL